MDYGKLYFYTSAIRHWSPLLYQYQFESVITDSLSFLHKNGCLNIYGFVIMPNQMHLILEQVKANGRETPIASMMKHTAHHFERFLLKEDPRAIEEFIVDWTSRKINFWQPHSDRFMLYTKKAIKQKLQYIHNNPLQERWMLVKNPVDYLYSSARFYETGHRNFSFLSHYEDWLNKQG